jgi:hypothetical protein
MIKIFSFFSSSMAGRLVGTLMGMMFYFIK